MQRHRTAALIASSSELSTAVVLFHGLIASRLGLHGTDHKALALLRDQGPMLAGRLGVLTGLSSGSVTALVNRLAHAGFVRRVSVDDDRRQQRIELVPNALAKLAPEFASLARAITRLAGNYGDDQLALVVDFLRAAIAILRRETGKLRQLDARSGASAARSRGLPS